MSDNPLSERHLPIEVFRQRILDALADGKKPAVNYAARSRQDKRGSIPDQLRENRTAAEADGYMIVGTFSDDGFSAYSGNRGPDLLRAMGVATLAGELTYKLDLPVEDWAGFWCNDPDRLARGAGDKPNATDALTEVWHKLRRAGVRPRAVYDDDDLVDEAAVGEKSKRSRKYSESLGRRTAQGKARRVKERQQSIAPTLCWGYMRVDGKEVPGPKTFPAAQRVWELGFAGEGASAVSRILAAEGLPSRPANRINEMWRSKYYAGFVNYGGEWVRGDHVPVITEEQFEEMQRQLGEPKKRPGRHAHRYALARMIRCGFCGQNMGVVSRSKGVNGNYECQTHGCPQPPLRRADADGAVLTYFKDLGLDREATLRALRDHSERQVGHAEAVLYGAQQSLGKLEAQKDRMWRMLRDDEIRGTDWTKFEAEYEEEKSALKAQIDQFAANLAKAEVENRVGEVEEALVERLQAIRQAAAGISKADDARAIQAAIRRLFVAFILLPDEGRIQAGLWLLRSRRKLVPVVHRDALKGVMPSGTPVLNRTQVDLVLSAGEDEGDAAAITVLSA